MQIVSPNPYIVRFDERDESAPCFLYLPPGRNDMVFVDSLSNINTVVSWPVWKARPQASPLGVFRAQTLEGKGVGLVATRLIAAGELICTERPIYVTRYGLQVPWAPNRTLAGAKPEGVFYSAALNGLSEDVSEKFYALQNAYPPTYDLVPGILNTNCLSITIGEAYTSDYFGCFPTLSRLNHDCRPNAKYMFDKEIFEGQVRAMRNIQPGQEITIPYTQLAAPREERQRSLFANRCFVCACGTCSLPPDRQRESDARREKIRELKRKLEDVQFPPRVPFEELREALAAAGDESLRVEYAEILLMGSQVLTIYDEVDLAKAWADKAREIFLQIEGARSYSGTQVLSSAAAVHDTMETNGTSGPLRN